MRKIQSIILCALFFLTSTAWTQSTPLQSSAHHFVNELKEEGLLGLTDQPAINIFLEQTCGNEVTLDLGISEKEKLFCEIVTKSDTCQQLPPEDLRNCSEKNNTIENGIDVIVGCAKGLFNSVKELLSFLWEAAKFIWNNVTDWDEAAETADAVGSFAQSIKLYLFTEYDKAYEKAEFPKGLNAAREVSSKIFQFLGSKISEILEDQYTKFGCLNPEAKTRKVCHVIGDLILPPAAFFAFLKRGVKAADEFPTLNKAFEGLNTSTKLSDYRVRLGMADELLGRQLSQAQQEAVIRAHLVGVGELGLDGTMAKVSNYTLAQLRRKSELLKEAGFTKEEIRVLMEGTIVGIGPDEFAKIPSPPTRVSTSPIAPDPRAEFEAVRSSLREGRVPKDPYISFLAPDGQRLPGRIESYDPYTAQSVIALTDGTRVTINADRLSSLKQSSTAKQLFNANKNPSFLPTHPHTSYESIRAYLRNGEVPADPYISFDAPSGTRLPAVIEQVDGLNGRVLVRLDNGEPLLLQGEDLLSIRSSTASREFFTNAQPSKNLIPPSSDPRVAPLRDSINNGVIPNDPFVSVMSADGSQRIAARVDNVDPKTGQVSLTFIDGSRELISGPRLETLKLSDTSKDAFLANVHLAPQSPRGSSGGGTGRARSQNIYNEDYQLPKNLDKIEEDFLKVRDEIFPRFHRNGGEYKDNGYWWQFIDMVDVDLPQQGWKFHVSAKPENMAQVARDVLPELKKLNIPHKVVGDFQRYAQSVGTSSSQQGKFITVYPRNTEEAQQYGRILKEIMQRRGYQSDDFLNIPNEHEFAPGVFGRYGRLVGGNLVRPDGRVIHGTDNDILMPNGEVMPDPRGAEIPSFVEPLNL